MRIILIGSLLHLAFCGLVRDDSPDEMDINDELSEEAFEALFGETPITDPVELEKHRQALAEEEEEVKSVNKEYLEGKKTWYEKIDEFSDLPFDEFEARRTGLIDGYSRGLIDSDEMDPESERYFDSYRLGRFSVPNNYSSVDLGYVTGVKDQGDYCASCVAFASIATIEVCFKKLTGVDGDYSEQQLVDCGFGINGANGCNKALAHSYLKTISETHLGLTHESNYPYINANGASCPSGLETYNRGAVVSKSYWTHQGTEDMLEYEVAMRGAAVSSIATDGMDWRAYNGGTYDGDCSTHVDHAITVVGYGTDDTGMKYWLIKNSW